MTRRVPWSIIVLLLAVGVMPAQDVRYNFDNGVNFAKFKTYKWVSIKDAQKLDNLVEKQVMAAVDAQLSTKGLTKTESDTADLFVGYQPAVGQEKQFTSYNSDWGYGGGWYRGGWYGAGMGSSITTGETSTIYIGQLALDMYDPANHDLIWRGVVSKSLDTKAKPEKRAKNLNKALTKLFKNYPPQGKG
jgi:hypothetical protein